MKTPHHSLTEEHYQSNYQLSFYILVLLLLYGPSNVHLRFNIFQATDKANGEQS